MLNPDLLALLVCPDTHQDVALASPDEVTQINAAIGQGSVRNVAGITVDQPVDGALIRADGIVAYPIRDDIPVMLVDEALSLAQVKLNGHG